MWPNGGPTHQSDIFFLFFLNVPKGSDDIEWLGRCQAHPVNMLKRPTSNATDACSWSPATSGCIFTHGFSFRRRHLFDKSVRRARRGRTEGAGTGWKWMSSGWARDGAGRRAGRKMCLPLKSPAAVRHNTIRLEIVFSSPSARLIPALTRLFSFICLAPLYCHNAADPESSHRSLVQLISEVAALQIRSLNLVAPYIRWRDHTFAGG